MVGKKNQQVHIAEHVSYFLAKIDNFFSFLEHYFPKRPNKPRRWQRLVSGKSARKPLNNSLRDDDDNVFTCWASESSCHVCNRWDSVPRWTDWKTIVTIITNWITTVTMTNIRLVTMIVLMEMMTTMMLITQDIVKASAIILHQGAESKGQVTRLRTGEARLMMMMVVVMVMTVMVVVMVRSSRETAKTETRLLITW